MRSLSLLALTLGSALLVGCGTETETTVPTGPTPPAKPGDIPKEIADGTKAEPSTAQDAKVD